MARLGWAAVLVLAARTAGAAELRDMLAVLDLSVEDEAVTDAVALTVTDGLRSAARKAAGTQLKIMTRENMLEMLPPGTDQRCFKGACLATIGRQIQARFVMGGAIRKVGSRLSVTVEAYESTGGNLLGAEVPKTRNVDELIDLIDKEAPGWIRTWIPGLAGATVAVAPLASVPVVSAPPPPAVAAGGPSIRRSSSTKAASDLTITAKPSEGVRLDITDPAGKTLASGVPYKNPQAAPGRWKVTARAAGYEDETRDVDVPADDTILAKIDMKLLGALSVTGTPAGAQVVVTGPGLPGGRDEGGLPWEASGLSSGSYGVKVTRTGYRDFDEAVQVEPGRTAEVTVALQRVAVVAEPDRRRDTSVVGLVRSPVVVVKTSLGTFKAELYEDKAPISVKNFLRYVDDEFYDGTIFHRVIATFMVQGGGFTPDMSEKPTRRPIRNEASNGLLNERGTLAMARTSVPDSATAQFYVNVVDNPFLDYRGPGPAEIGYAVFGRVTEGMDVVDKIKAVRTGFGSNGMPDVPKTPVIIESIRGEK